MITTLSGLTQQAFQRMLAGANLLSGGPVWPEVPYGANVQWPRTVQIQQGYAEEPHFLVVSASTIVGDTSPWEAALKDGLKTFKRSLGPTSTPSLIIPGRLTAQDVWASAVAANMLRLPLLDAVIQPEPSILPGLGPTLLLYGAGRTALFQGSWDGAQTLPAQLLEAPHIILRTFTPLPANQIDVGRLAYADWVGQCLESGKDLLAALLERGDLDGVDMAGAVTHLQYSRPSGGRVVVSSGDQRLELLVSNGGIAAKLDGQVWATSQAHIVVIRNNSGHPVPLSQLSYGQRVTVLRLPRYMRQAVPGARADRTGGTSSGNA